MTPTPIRHLVFLLVCVVLGGIYLGYQACVNSRIEFLRPSLRGTWIVHPNPPIKPVNMTTPFVSYDVPTCPNATFAHQFTLPSRPAAFPVHVTAMRAFHVSINGQSLGSYGPHSWKRGHSLDLSPFLVNGINQIEITIDGDENPPALLLEGPQIIRSDRRWTVTLVSDPATITSAARALRDESYFRARPSALRQSSLFPFILTGFLLYCLWLTYTILHAVFRALKEQSPDRSHDSSAERSWCRRHGLCLAIGLAVALVHIHNFVHYPPTRSDFDWRGHGQYVQYVVDHWRVPVASSGWEMFQPPLYYFVAATMSTLFGGLSADPLSVKAVQWISTMSGLWNVAVAWLILWTLFPTASRLRTLGFSVAAMMPMGFYMNAMVNNEIFAASLIGTAIWLVLRNGFGQPRSWRGGAVIGFVCGLALLSRYTALFVFLSVFMLSALRLATRRRICHPTIVAVVLALGMCGWYYARNAWQFHDPFVGNWDNTSGFHYEQQPGYRTLGFYTHFGSVFLDHPERSLWASFGDGLYASAWTDAHGTFLDMNDVTTQVVAGIILMLALLPSVAIAMGFSQSVGWLIQRDWDHPYLILVVTSLLTFFSVIAFTMEVPFFSTVKSTFLLSLIPAISVFAGLGLDTLCHSLGRGRWVLYGNLGVLYTLILYLFWYRGT